MVTKSAAIIMADGYEEVEAVTPIDLLRRAGIDVTLYGLTSLKVRGSHDIIIKTDKVLPSNPALADAVILPGGPGHKNLLNSAAVIEFVQKSFKAGCLCAAICAAPVVLGKAGILAGKRVTCFPGCEDNLAGGLFVDQPVVVDGNIITSRGAGTAVPFAVEIISCLVDRFTAGKIASAIIYD
jgi:4-methyl-5(b-hydroxyethyl)-thiazole monophosphate biosynthesis